MEEEDSSESSEEYVWMHRTTSKEKLTLSKIVMISESEILLRSGLSVGNEDFENEGETSLSEEIKEELVESETYSDDSIVRSEASTPISSPQDSTEEEYEINTNDQYLINYDSLTLTEDELKGFLTDRIIASGLSDVGCCPVSKGYVYTKLSLLNKSLTDITLLEYHRYLQVIDLSHNHLKDISALSVARYLQQLDVSYNLLNTAPGFAAPLRLHTANFSHNLITYLEDFAEFSLLQNLDLCNNYIHSLNDLHSLRYLEYLNISYNDLDTLQSVSDITAKRLNLEGNPMTAHYTDLPVLKNVKYLTLNFCLLKTLFPLKEMHMLQELEARNSRIDNLLDVNHLKGLRNLLKLDLRENEITGWRKYRQYVVSVLATLCYLDGKRVTWIEKIQAKTEFDPDLNLVAACVQTRNKVLENWSQSCVGPETFPIDQGTYPIIVLVGPPGSSKTNIAIHVATTIPDKNHHQRRPQRKHRHPHQGEPVDGWLILKEVKPSKHVLECISWDLISVVSQLKAKLPAKVLEMSSVAARSQNFRVHLAVSHTTKRKNPEDVDGVIHYFISQSEFSALASSGAFVSVSKKTGQTDGLAWSEIAKAVKKKCISITFMNLPSALQLFSSRLQPTLILALPRDENLHMEALRQKYALDKGYVEAPKPQRCKLAEGGPLSSCHCRSFSDVFTMEQYLKNLLSTREKYFKMHAENPGLFLKTIYTDEPDEAIEQIVEIIHKQYDRYQPCDFPSHPDYQKIFSPEILNTRLDTFQLQMNDPF